MTRYTFTNVQFDAQEERKAQRIAREAERLGVPAEFAEDAMWELDITRYSVRGAALSLKQLYKATNS